MSERTEKFQIAGAPRLVLRLPAGEVRVVPGAAGEVVVRARGDQSDLARLRIESHGETVTVEPQGLGWRRWAQVDVAIAVGEAPDIRARLAAGDLFVDAPSGEVDVTTASGGVTAGVVHGRLAARVASGDVAATAVGSLSVVAASGSVRVGRVLGSAEVRTASGDVDLGTVAGELSAHTASGDLEISRFEGGRLTAKTVSGDVQVGVPAGRRYAVSLQSLSGEVRTQFPVGDEAGGLAARLEVSSISGDITIGAAPAG